MSAVKGFEKPKPLIPSSIRGPVMNALSNIKFGISIIAAAASLSAASLALAASPSNPVCSPQRDVNTVIGRAVGPAVSADCFAAQKIRTTAGARDVTNVFGQSSILPYYPKDTLPTVATLDHGNSPVALVLGRSSDSIRSVLSGGGVTLVNSPQE
jgi:hypothetical protein